VRPGHVLRTPRTQHALVEDDTVDAPRGTDRIGTDRRTQWAQVGGRPEPGEREMGPEPLLSNVSHVPERNESAFDLSGELLGPLGTFVQPECEDPRAPARAERVRAAETDLPGTEIKGVELESGRDRGQVGIVAEELHGEVPLIARRRASREHRRGSDPRLDRVEHRGRRPDRDERARHRPTF